MLSGAKLPSMNIASIHLHVGLYLKNIYTETSTTYLHITGVKQVGNDDAPACLSPASPVNLRFSNTIFLVPKLLKKKNLSTTPVALYNLSHRDLHY